MRSTSEITIGRLKELLHYDPDTGIFTWKIVPKYGRVTVGSEAGTKGRKDGNTRIQIDGTIYEAIRLAWLYMTGKWPCGKIIRQISMTDAWNNLRDNNTPLQDITQERLKELLHYDVESGVFTWKVTLNSKAVCGKVAGIERKDGYVIIGVDNKRYYAHRLAWLYVTGTWPVGLIDHKKTLSNAFDNLRDVDRTGNAQNIYKPRKDNDSSSTVPGVTFLKVQQKWRVSLNYKGERIAGGCYATQTEAEAVCLGLRRQHYACNML